jgi:hypothetical protein
MLEPGIAVPESLDRPRGVRISNTLLRTISWAVVAVICAEYVAYFATLHSYPMQDFPNHLARGVVISDLLFNHGAVFGHIYSLSLVPVPYVLHDLVLATLIELFGTQAGGAIFMLIVLLSLPLALMFYMWAARLTPRAKPIVFLIGLYLSTDCFFLLAFMGFRLALALMLVCLGLAELLRRQWSMRTLGAYAAMLIVGYLTHLTATVFFATALAVSTVIRLGLRTTTLRREAALWIPLGLLIVAHATVLAPPHSASNPVTYQFYWGTWQKKFQHILFEYTRFGSRLERPMLLLVFACLIWPLRRQLQLRRLLEPGVLEPLAIAGAFLATYFLLPQFYSDSAFVDVRALPVVLIMILLACLNVPGPGASGRAFATWTVLAMASILAIVNFAFLVRHVGKYEKILSQYRELGNQIPRNSYVLPVDTSKRDGELRPLLHSASYFVADRGAVIPYLFSGDRGDPMKYFRYRQRPYWPEEDWYRTRKAWDRATEQTYVVAGKTYTWRFELSKEDGTWGLAELVPIDWNRVACAYDYMVLMQPVDLSLIEVPTRPIQANPVAALAAVDRSGCRPGEVPTKTVRLPAQH